MPLLKTLKGRFVAVILATTLVALLANAVFLMMFEYRSYRSSQLEDVRGRADILGRAAAAALAFDDSDDAYAMLRVVGESPEVLAAVLYRPNGKAFASYGHEEVPPVPAAPGGFSFDGERTHGFLPIVQNGAAVGTVYLSVRNNLGERLLAYFGVLGAVLALSFGLAFVLSARLQRAVTTPILNVVDAARKVMQGHDYSVRVRHLSNDETGLLADAFNAMLGEVEKRSAELRHEMGVRAEAEQALRKADKRKDEFLATLAHELRNPMAPVRSSVQLIKMKAPADADVRWACDVADRQLSHLTRLLDDLLDVGRITANKLELRKSVAPLRLLIETALETSRPAIDAAAHVLSLSLHEHPVWLDVDPVRFAQVLSNILINAAKYTPAGGLIQLSVHPRAGSVSVKVRDNGIGISPANLAGVFDMFAQADPATARTQGGLGIGLFLAKHLVELHGGTVTAESAGPGKGSAFTVTMPTAAPPGGAPAEAPAAGAVSRMRVLIADDNADAAATLGALLELSGYRVHVATDGALALDMASRLQPDFAVLDIGMPGLTGHEVARRIRREDWGQTMVLIAVTGWGQEADKRTAIESGFDHHVTKPADASTILKLLRVP